MTTKNMTTKNPTTAKNPTAKNTGAQKKQDRITNALTLLATATEATDSYLKTVTAALSASKGLADTRIPDALGKLANSKKSADMMTLRGFLVNSIVAMEWVGKPYASKIDFVRNSRKSEILKPASDWKIGNWMNRPVQPNDDPVQRTMKELQNRSGSAIKSAHNSLINAAARFVTETGTPVSDDATLAEIGKEFSVGALVVTPHDIRAKLSPTKKLLS
jgi:hypothetical protein